MGWGGGGGGVGSGRGCGQCVINVDGWSCHGHGHRIFDASGGVHWRHFSISLLKTP